MKSRRTRKRPAGTALPDTRNADDPANRGDFSRNTYRPEKRYSRVRMQQGVPVVDADWNETEDVQRDEWYNTITALSADGVGDDFSFRIKGIPNDVSAPEIPWKPDDFLIRGGDGTTDDAACAILGGWPALGESDLAYTKQRLYQNEQLAEKWGVPVLPALDVPKVDRVDLVYLDLWERTVDAAEDPDLINLEIGVESCVRRRYEWVVRVNEGSHDLPMLFPIGHRRLPLALLHRVEGDLKSIEDLRPIGFSLVRSLFFSDQGVGVGGDPGDDIFRVTQASGSFRISSDGARIEAAPDSTETQNDTPGLHLSADNRGSRIQCEPEQPLLLQPAGKAGVTIGADDTIDESESEVSLRVAGDVALRSEVRLADLQVQGELHALDELTIFGAYGEPQKLSLDQPVIESPAVETDGYLTGYLYGADGNALTVESPPGTVRMRTGIQTPGAPRIQEMENGPYIAIGGGRAVLRKTLTEARIYELDPGGKWIQTHEFSTVDSFDAHIYDDILVLNGLDDGKNHVYEIKGNGWANTMELPGIANTIYDHNPVAVTGERCCVLLPDKKTVRIYRRDTWEVELETPPDPAESVSMSGEQVAIGYPMQGYVRVYQYVENKWTGPIELLHEDERLGHTVAIDGDHILSAAEKGPVVHFRKTNGAWKFQGTIDFPEQVGALRVSDSYALIQEPRRVSRRAHAYRYENESWRKLGSWPTYSAGLWGRHAVMTMTPTGLFVDLDPHDSRSFSVPVRRGDAWRIKLDNITGTPEAQVSWLPRGNSDQLNRRPK